MRPRWQPVWGAVGSLVLITLGALPTRAVAQPCAAVDAEVEALIRSGAPAKLLLEIAHDLGPRGLPALIVRAQAGDPDATLALGLTGQEGALRALREKRIGRQPERSLALFALGDGAETATVAYALAGAPAPADRARAAAYLGQLETVRARELLEAALNDPDPLVRFEAAKPLARARYPKARRVLRDLARTGPESLRALAADVSDRAPTGDAQELMDELENEATPSPSADAGTPAKKDKDVPAASALSLARTRMSGPDGEALRAAIRLVEQAGARSEVPSLVVIARRTDVGAETRATALGAALRLCPK